MTSFTLGLLTPLADSDWHGPGPWIVFVPLIWISLFVLAVVLLRRRGAVCGPWGPRGYGNRMDAQSVLERRFAEGDITAQEFRDRREVLNEAQDRS